MIPAIGPLAPSVLVIRKLRATWLDKLAQEDNAEAPM